MNNGQKLSLVIRQILEDKDTTLSQRAEVATADGTFEPEDWDDALKEVLVLDLKDKTAELIKIVKRLPMPPKKDTNMKFVHQNGTSYTLAEFMTMGQESRHLLEGMRIINSVPCPNWRDSLRAPEENKNDLELYDPKYLSRK